MKRGVERLYRLARRRASCELANRQWDAGTIISYGALDRGPTDTRIFNYRGLTLTMRSILHWVMAASSIEKRQAFREVVAVANTHNSVLVDGSPAETGWKEINKMRLISVCGNRKLFGVFAISLLVCAAACCLTLAANAQTNSTAAKIEVKLSEYKIDMPDTVPAGSTTFEVTNTGKEVHNFEIEGNGIEKRVGKLKPGESKTLLVELKAGKYEVYCPVPGHKSHGMSLDLTVR